MLVAIAIPVFSAQLEKSREGTDMANIRSAYAEVMAKAISTVPEQKVSAKVSLKQQQNSWQTSGVNLAGKGVITGADHVDVSVTGSPMGNGTATVSYAPASGASAAKVTISFS